MRKSALLTFVLFFSISSIHVNAQQSLKVFISVDMEGIVGVVHSDQVSASGNDYSRFRKIMTESANAAIQGAIDAGATEIVVNDSHGSMRNLMIENLNPAARLLSGSPKKLSMMEGINNTFDAVVFIGYHASMGVSNSILDHTMSSRRIANILMNSILMNEGSMNSAIAGYFGVPVVFAAGDRGFVDEVNKIVGTGFESLAVKDGVGRNAALNLSVKEAHEKIRSGVKKGIDNRKNIQLYKIDQPVTLEMEFLYSNMAEQLDMIPGVKRISGRKIRYTGSDFIETYMLMRALLSLAGS